MLQYILIIFGKIISKTIFKLSKQISYATNNIVGKKHKKSNQEKKLSLPYLLPSHKKKIVVCLRLSFASLTWIHLPSTLSFFCLSYLDPSLSSICLSFWGNVARRNPRSTSRGSRSGGRW